MSPVSPAVPESHRAQPLYRRITGIETEYGIACMAGAQRRMNPDEIARYTFRPLFEAFRSTNTFIPNAGRVYLDVGSHPEYATPECDGISQLIAYDKAGDRIIGALGATAEQRLAAEGIGGQVYLYKNNTDSVGNSYGSHENYLVSRSTVLKVLGRDLVPFLISRQILTGAGKVLVPRSGVHGNELTAPLYAFSQRADHVWESVSSATTRSRPIINTRDEPHADSTLYRRLHVIVGDSNLAEPTLLLRIGATHLVLEMIESGRSFPHLEIADPILAVRRIARDLTGQRTVETTAGTQLSGLDLQYAYLAAAKDYAATRPEAVVSDSGDPQGLTSADVAKLLDLWERTLQAIETGDHSGIAGEIDWAIKKQLIDAFCERHSVDLGDPRVQLLDLAYHDINPQRGLYARLAARGRITRIITDEAIEQAAVRAPQSTRAKLRGDFLAAARHAGVSHQVDWMHIRFTDPEAHSLALGDPFATTHPEVEEFIAEFLARPQAEPPALADTLIGL